jgi:multidrug efflux pump
VDRIQAMMPYLESSVSPAIKFTEAMDRTVTVRASVKDIETTLLISVILVILVVFAFLRTVRATIIPSIAVPLSLVGTFGGMYLLGYSLDNLSLMALAISTGFVVDDAIVVLENIMRHVEHGMGAVKAAFQGASEIGFTVVSMSVSLVAVFIPLLMMGGIVGRLFREFAVTLSMAITVSLVISLTTTPTMCAKFLRPPKPEKHNRFYRASEWVFEGLLAAYTRALKWVLAYQPVTLTVTVLVACLSVYLYIIVPKGFFPQQDTGRIMGAVMGSQDISFQAMSAKMKQYVGIVMKDPAVESVVGFAGGNTAQNQGRFFMMLKRLEQRGPCNKQHFWQSCHYVTADDVINRLRGKLTVVPGACLFISS